MNATIQLQKAEHECFRDRLNKIIGTDSARSLAIRS